MARREKLIEKMAAARGLKLGSAKQPGAEASEFRRAYPPDGGNRNRWTLRRKYARGLGLSDSNSLSIEIALVGREWARLAIEIERRFPAYAALMAPELPTIDRAQGRLKPDQALIATYTGEAETYVWAVPKRGQPAFATVPMGRAKMTALVNRLRKGLEYRDDTLAGIPVFDVGLAHALYKALLEPVARGWKGAKDLLVVAHGPLGQLPFSLLVTAKAEVKDGNRALFSGYKDVPWLIRSHSVTTLPTVGSMMALLRRSSRHASRRRRYSSSDSTRRSRASGLGRGRPRVGFESTRPTSSRKLKNEAMAATLLSRVALASFIPSSLARYSKTCRLWMSQGALTRVCR